MDVIVSTPNLSDQFDQQVDIVEPLFKHYGSLKQGYGQITTVSCFEDNSLVAEQVKLPGNGGVLVVDGGASLRYSLLGDQLAAAAIEIWLVSNLNQRLPKRCRDYRAHAIGGHGISIHTL